MGGVSFNVAAKTKPSKKRGGRRRKTRVPRAMSKYNPQPVFTETCRLTIPDTAPAINYQMSANTTGLLQVQMDMLPQLSQYSALYQKYRILKVQYLCLGTYNTQSSDINVAQAAIGTGVTYGMGRIAFVVQSSPAVQAPANEQAVLVCNGAKVISAKPKWTVSHKPVPTIVDALNNTITMKAPYLNFVTSGFNQIHGAVPWSYTLPSTNPALDPFYAVYAKITFQLSDPR